MLLCLILPLPRTWRIKASGIFPLCKPKQNALSPLSLHLAVSILRQAVYAFSNRLHVSQSLKVVHSALDLHARITTQTERKTFSIVFLHWIRLYKWVWRSRSNFQVCRCLAVWSLGSSLIFLYLSFSILESRDCVTTGLPQFWLSLLNKNIYVSIHW